MLAGAGRGRILATTRRIDFTDRIHAGVLTLDERSVVTTELQGVAGGAFTVGAAAGSWRAAIMVELAILIRRARLVHTVTDESRRDGSDLAAIKGAHQLAVGSYTADGVLVELLTGRGAGIVVTRGRSA